ncbi:hypothetical protein [uncultured Lacinutrix sp.]|uniref:hypothetical protein n=1 Tax=uncultured Lacinutrix sp. TaxID=574032 RepID=UPI00261EC993|nr:hypothetical protein [uncultured Lacinutrix sp.]
MIIDNTISFLKKLKTQNSSKKELDTYNAFIRVLTDVKHRNFNSLELNRIEQELELLDIELNTERKTLNKKLHQFFEFLKNEFSLISKDYYKNNYMALGMCFGSAAGIILGVVSLPIGLVLGMVIGMYLGSEKDKKAKEEGRVLNFTSFESMF